ncbi:Beta-galactosidase C-terminal domain [Persicirhabdus sediminis]|uniref:Beta-galactosidase C-terminal domain n=1 Tax=Persicirhabdus sediminis TaxID=454144 RepID=A0A8J7SKM5_9BACT|nr:Beta-galactosidase C-terminal domain [Persicirhabdus sediminis]
MSARYLFILNFTPTEQTLQLQALKA